MIIASMLAHVVDDKGVFLHGEFEDREIIHMKIPQGFKKHFPEGVRMFDCCLQGIKPCECKGKGYQWVGNRVFRLGSRKELRKERDLRKRSPKTFLGI